jgi:hypothetical protein
VVAPVALVGAVVGRNVDFIVKNGPFSILGAPFGFTFLIQVTVRRCLPRPIETKKNFSS